MSKDTLDYVSVEDPKFARFDVLPKIHKWLYDVPGSPVISNCGYYTESISLSLDYHLQTLAQKIKSCIKDTNHSLSKLKILDKLPQAVILCSIEIVGLHPNIPHIEGLTSLQIFLNWEITNKTQVTPP